MVLSFTVTPTNPERPVLVERVPAMCGGLPEFLPYKDRLFFDHSLVTHGLLDHPPHTYGEFVAELVGPTVSSFAADSAVSVP
jgi:hypothetical protein